MHLGGVLPQAGGDHMLGLLDRHAIHMVDRLADLVIAPAMRRTGQGEIVVAEIQPLGHHQLIRAQRRGQVRHHRFGRRRADVILAHHHPAHIIQHYLIPLVQPARAHIDHAGLAVGILLQPDHLRGRADRIPRIDRLQPAPLGIAQIGDGVQRDIGHRLAEDDVKGRQIIQRAFRQAATPREFVRRIKRVPHRIKRVIHRPLATRNSARHRVVDHLPDMVILKKPAGTRLDRNHMKLRDFHSLLSQFDLGGIGAGHLFDNGLTAAHHAIGRVKRVRRTAMQHPALVQRRRHLVAEGIGVIGGQETVKLHRITPETARRPARHGWRSSRQRRPA